MRENLIQVDYTELRAIVRDMGHERGSVQRWLVIADREQLEAHDTEAAAHLLRAAWYSGYEAGGKAHVRGEGQMQIEVHIFEDAEGVEDSFTTQNAAEAREYARANNRKWIARTFEYTDSEVVEDNTRAD